VYNICQPQAANGMESKKRPNEMASHLVTIVIPTRNAGRTLGNCLKSIRNQTYQNLEIILVDAGSTDETQRIAEEYGARIVTLEGIGMTAARNVGTKRASGDYVFHMDADMKLQPLVVEECVDKCKRGVRAVIVPQLFEGTGFLGRAKALEIQSYPHGNPGTCTRFVEKALLEGLGGYDEALEAGEDWDLAQKMGARYPIGAIEAYITHGWGRYDLIKRMKQCYRYGKSVGTYVKKYPRHAAGQWTPLRVSNMKLDLLVSHPVEAFGIAVLKFCEFEAALLGILSDRFLKDK